MDIAIFGLTHRCGSTLIQRVFNANRDTLVWGESRLLNLMSELMARARHFPDYSDKHDLLGKYLRSGRRDTYHIANLNPPAARLDHAAVAGLRALYRTNYPDYGHARVGFKEVTCDQASVELARRAWPGMVTVMIARHYRNSWESLPEGWNLSREEFVNQWFGNIEFYQMQDNFFWFEDLLNQQAERDRLARLAEISPETLGTVFGNKVGGTKKRRAFTADLEVETNARLAALPAALQRDINRLTAPEILPSPAATAPDGASSPNDAGAQ